MTWHTLPKDDAWKQVTPQSVAELGQQLWLRCDACGHELYLEPLDFARRHGLDPRTPLLRIGEALRCVKCGERKGGCRPAPYRIGER
jgi:hypothetical protein